MLRHPLVVLLFATGVAPLCRGVGAPAGKTIVTTGLVTRWAADVTPENAWRDYPRPQMVRDAWGNLNGRWDYAVAPRTAPAPASYAGAILVPFPIESKLSGVGHVVSPTERIWYHRAFGTPAAWTGQRVLLHFGAVDWECTVWVNGGLVGSHTGGYDPFSFDVTAFLHPGGGNDVVVAVTNPTNDYDQPRGKQRLPPAGIWYAPSSGIWQTVWLEPVPRESSIGELRITPDVDHAQVRVSVLGYRPDEDDVHAVRVRVLQEGRVVAEATNRIDRTLTLALPQPRLWAPEHPFLYDVQVDLFRIPSPYPAPSPQTPRDVNPVPGYGAAEQARFTIPADATPLDSVRSYFGMRKITVGPGGLGPVIELNNQPYFECGTLDQGFWPDGLYTAPSAAAMRWDLDFLKRAGFNMLRKHIKVEPAAYYAYCDHIGLLVWQDMPAGFVSEPAPGGSGGRRLDRSEVVRAADAGEPIRRSWSAAQYELELRRMIDALYNSPAVVTWIPFNEGWGQFDSARIARWVKDYDPSRLVDAASGWKDVGAGDVQDVHTYAPTLALPATRDPHRAFIVGEFGGIGLPVAGHLWFPDRANSGYQTYQNAAELAAQYRARFDRILAALRERGLSAAVYTQTTDVEGEVNGLVTYDRAVEKIDAATLATIHAPAYQR